MSPPDKWDDLPQSAHKRMATGQASAGTLKFFTIDQVADFLGLSPRSVRRLINGHQLPVHRFGRAARIAEADLRAYIATHRE
jgi:excisionase family DNA binding protein